MLEPFARTYFTALTSGVDLVWLGDRHGAIVDALESAHARLAARVMRDHADEARDLIASGRSGRMTLCIEATLMTGGSLARRCRPVSGSR